MQFSLVDRVGGRSVNYHGNRVARDCFSMLAAFALLFGVSLQSTIAQEAESASQQMTARVDELLESRLAELKWGPAEAATDAAFLRRASLDLTGASPTASEVIRFQENSSETKRDDLIDRLLLTPKSAGHMASTWAGWMLPEDRNPLLGAGGNGLQGWLRDRFAENLRYDRLVSDLLVASGPARSGPSAFFISLEAKPEKIAAKTARVFLGVQLDCAECHDHPFDDWTQEDFWGFAAYFAQLSTDPNMALNGQGELGDAEEGEVMLPDTEEVVAPKPLVDTGFSGIETGTRRQQLTLWLTARENPFLARATVNRVWAMLFGQGLIEPIDDMRSLEMASHPQILKELSEYFAASGYNLRELVATLAKTDAYRRASEHPKGEPPENSYATMTTKPLTELQLANTLSLVARQVGADEQQLQTVLAARLGKLRGDASEAKLGIVSALVTLHGSTFDGVSRDGSSRLLKALEAPFMDGPKQLRWLFLSTLSREPSEKESSALAGFIDQSQSTEDEIGATWKSDLLWALVNSTEFAMTP